MCVCLYVFKIIIMCFYSFTFRFMTYKTIKFNSALSYLLTENRFLTLLPVCSPIINHCAVVAMRKKLFCDWWKTDSPRL